MEENSENQKEVESYCKVCHKDRMFVTSLSPIGNIICCICGYRQSIIPFKMVVGTFGYNILQENKNNDKYML